MQEYLNHIISWKKNFFIKRIVFFAKLQCLERVNRAIKLDFSYFLEATTEWFSQKQRVEMPAIITAIYALVFAALSLPLFPAAFLRSSSSFANFRFSIAYRRKTSETGLNLVINLPHWYYLGSLKSSFTWSRWNPITLYELSAKASSIMSSPNVMKLRKKWALTFSHSMNFHPND